MTDGQGASDGKVSFKSLDSESMAAARAAAEAAGLSLEEWLSRTILRNTQSLGITGGPDKPEPVEQEDPQGSLEAITQHLEDAQRAAEAAGVSVAEWLSRSIVERTSEGQRALSEYSSRRQAPPEQPPEQPPDQTGPTDAEVIERTDRYTRLQAEQGNRRVTVQVDHPVLSEEEIAETPAESAPGAGADDYPPPASSDSGAQQEPQKEGLSPEDERRLAELITRRRDEQSATRESARTTADEDDGTLALTTPAPPEITDTPQVTPRADWDRPARRRRGSRLWFAFMILLALLAAAVWVVPNLDEFGLAELFDGTESVPVEETAGEGSESASGGTEDVGGDPAQGAEAQDTPGDDLQEGAPESVEAGDDAGETDLALVPEARFPRPASEHVEWYRQAADAGNARAQYVLGTLFLQGSGVERDFSRAADWFRQAAEQGNLAQAQYALGVLYERGIGVEENALEALILFQNAADQGHVLALTKVAEAYLHGRGIGQNYDQARRNFERAAEAGEPNAQYALGRMHELGLGVETDLVEALKWFILAGEGNHQEAASRVEAIVPELRPEQRTRASDLVTEHRRRFGSSD